MSPRILQALLGLAVLLGGLTALAVWSEHRQANLGAQAEHAAAVHEGEANAHVSQAQAIPDHSAALAQAQADVAGARAEVERLRRIVAAQRRQRVPDPAGPAEAPAQPVEPDHRDELLAADAVLIARQDAQIQWLKAALADEQKRSEQWRQAFEDERKRALAQEAATEAWRSAVKTSRWTGRAEGAGTVLALVKLAGLL